MKATQHIGETSRLGIADYFVLCGLDDNSDLEPLRGVGGIVDHADCTPLERSYKSKVLGHYPNSVPWNAFNPDAVCTLCLPSGLQFRTQKHKLDPCFHSFIITKEDGSNTFGFSYVFYEEVTAKQICTAMQTLQAMHLTELSSCSRSPAHLQGVADGPVTRSLPRHFKLTAKHSDAARNYYDYSKDTLYVSKSIALLCQVPFVHACRKFLTGLYRHFLSDLSPKLSLESYVSHFLFEVPLPLLGQSISLPCFGEQIICQRPSRNELPFFDYSLREFFSLLKIDCILQLLTCVLLEYQVILQSHNLHYLMLVAESIKVLMYPFMWQHVYVPVLPASLHDFLDAPVPFLMGLQKGHKSCKADLHLPSEANLCFLDIDRRHIQLPEDLPLFPGIHTFHFELKKVLQQYCVPVDNFEEPDATLAEQMQQRKMSCSFIDEGSSSSSRGNGSTFSVHRSDALQRLTAIAKQQGINVDSYDDVLHEIDGNQNFSACLVHPNEDEYLVDLRFNNSVRETFLNHFVHMFFNYEHFVIQPDQSMSQWLQNKDSMNNFDKATFLFDQPEPHLPFLSRFIETQLFATFVDSKIMDFWGEHDEHLVFFDNRIKLLRDRYGECLVRTLPISIPETEALLVKRMSTVSTVVPNVFEVLPDNCTERLKHFPLLNEDVMRRDLPHGRTTQSSWKSGQLSKEDKSGNGISRRVSQIEDMVYTRMLETLRLGQQNTEVNYAKKAQANWMFVTQLLKECKSKTKRMLVQKMGTEAVELGHGDVVMGVEENTLVASLCDLLERIWSHGLKSRQGKSALWLHLLSYQELKEPSSMIVRPPQRNFHAPRTPVELFSRTFEGDLLSPSRVEKGRSPERREKLRSASHGPENRKVLRPLPVSLFYDMRCVAAMTDIKTHIGYARAWVKLSLEKKTLSQHLRTLLSSTKLLRGMYKRNAFLRTDEEKEQLLCHLLSLNAVDFFCFTNTYTKISIPYHIVIVPSRKTASATSANCWVNTSGTLGETGNVPIARGSLDFIVHHRNLGVLTTLRIGHDNYGVSPKWMVENVLVRNEISGHIYRFPCGRWLGKGMDDGSTERLLVGELLSPHMDVSELAELCYTPPRCRSPSIPRRATESRLSVSDMQQMLADAVNNIVKHYFKPEKERGSLTALLIGENGLVFCIEQIFSYGFKSSRLFGKLYLWDYFVKTKDHFETMLKEESEKSPTHGAVRSGLEHVVVMRSFCNLINKISEATHTLGKDGKLQLFICLSARERLLHRMLLHIAATPVTGQMFEEHSFLRDANLITYLMQIIKTLDEYEIVLEHSLTKGIELT